MSATTTKTIPQVGGALWSIEETARFLGVPEKTLYQWRHKRVGPPSHKVGRHVRYFPEAVMTWVREQH